MRSLGLEFGLSPIEDRAVPRFRRWGLIGVLVAALASGALPGLAQGQETGRIIGRVTAEETGAPISAAQVYLPGLQLGGLSRPNGSYLILGVPAGTHEVRVERIGMATANQQITVTADGVVVANFALATEALGLDEIVVTGTAGAARRREVGNTINQINVANVPARANLASELIQGAAPGVLMTKHGGVMGSGVNIKLRGNQSISMSNQPIIYVDGIRLSRDLPSTYEVDVDELMPGNNGVGAQLEASPLHNINPNDIERIEIIKGSAATTLYGTDAAAGVIQIFTKRGSTGAPVWNVEARRGYSRAFKVGGSFPTQDQRDRFPYLRLKPYIQTGHDDLLSASVRGGSDAFQYFMSSGHNRGTGLTVMDSIRKTDLRGNFTFRPMESVTIQYNSVYSRQWTSNVLGAGGDSGLLHQAYRGLANYHGDEDPALIGQIFEQSFTSDIERFTTGGTLTYSPMDALTNRLTVGYDYTRHDTRYVRPYGFFAWPEGDLALVQLANRVFTLDYVGTYRINVTNSIRSNFSWGGQAVGEGQNFTVAYGTDFPGVTQPTISSASQTRALESRQQVWNAGFFFQNVFDISDRYFVTVGARVDGNSAFGAGFGLQFYPKASASWVISDESFWSEGLGAMKLRAAYGQSGRAPGPFDAVRTWAQDGGYDERPAIMPQNVGNADLGPEVTREFEAGFDADWFNGRLSTSFTYYDQRTSSALLQVAQIQSNGFGGSQLQNVGVIDNWGTELSINASPIATSNWGMDVGFNVATNGSKVVDIGGIPPFRIGTYRRGWVMEGQPAPVMRDYYTTNPDEIADPIIEQYHLYGPGEPTLTLQPSLTLRGPGGILVAARGEYMSGHWSSDQNHATGMVRRGGWSPACWPYYVNPYDGEEWGWDLPHEVLAKNPGMEPFSTVLKADTPALWRARCTPSSGRRHGQWAVPADHFRIRSLSMQIPVDFAFPDRVSSSMLTITATEPFRWYNSQWIHMDPEMIEQKGGSDSTYFRGPAQRLPPTWGVSTSLRVTF